MTKGKILEDLSKIINTAKILPLLRFKIYIYEYDKDNIVTNIQNYFKDEFLIIRSSANNEDGQDNSNAGHYKSILNVPKNDKSKIIEAINKVIESYDSKEGDQEIFVQPMLSNIKLSGVVFTADMDTLSPYYIINYDKSGKSDIITSGNGGNTKTFICSKFKNSSDSENADNSYILKICDACKELEKIFSYHFLDIEFAFDNDNNLYIFQCRPISVKNKENLSQVKLQNSLLEIYKKFDKLSSNRPNLLGDKTIFGVMPDWNPAEMIGMRPKQLAQSLYKVLILDNIWAQQRYDYGYRDVRSHPLMVTFLGIPYIDVRVDFNSFVPKSLEENIANKLIKYYINKLDSNPANHDKVEFNIVYTCYYPGLSNKLKELLDMGFNEDEIKKVESSLINLTNRIIEPKNGIYRKDIQKIEILKEKYKDVVSSDLSLIEKIYWLVEYCKEYGTLPFSGIARSAFIGVQILKSFVELNLISKEEYENFMSSLNTIAKKLNYDLYKLSKGDISKEEFLAEYGHLRPNSYDILSWRYDENFGYYFSSIGISKNGYGYQNGYPKNVKNIDNVDIKNADINVDSFLTDEKIKKIDNILKNHKFEIEVRDLFQFIKDAIQAREYSKFVFTKSLSEILRLIEQLGKSYEIGREELAYLDIRIILNLYSVIDHRGIKNIFLSEIEKNKELYKYTKAIKLPALIRRSEDIYGFYLENEEPNFITLKKTKAALIMEEEFKNGNIQNNIAFIKSADPGYDYLFTKHISGLVTQFGGANSHMAIRCAELGIPAIIGAGEKNFTEWSKAQILEIDCANKRVNIIS